MWQLKCVCSDLLRCVCLSDHLSDVSDHTEISRHSHLKLLIFIFVSFLFKMPQRVFVVYHHHHCCVVLHCFPAPLNHFLEEPLQKQTFTPHSSGTSSTFSIFCNTCHASINGAADSDFKVTEVSDFSKGFQSLLLIGQWSCWEQFQNLAGKS